MRIWYYVKSTLKGMISSLPVVCGYFILFPILIAGVMGFAGSFHNKELKIKPVTIKIENLDNSEISKNLVDFLKSKEVEKIAKVSEESKNVIIIPKDYGKDMIDFKSVELKIKQGNPKDREGLGSLKSVVAKYNENLYLSLKGQNVEKINSIQNAKIMDIKDIGQAGKEQGFGRSASISISFVLSLLIYSLIKSGNMDLGINIYKRIKTFTLTREKIYVYDFVGQSVYIGLIILGYTMFFRLIGVAFTGNILELLTLIVVTTILSSAIVSAVSNIFEKKLSNIIGGIIFFLFCFGGELFPFLGEALKSPTLLIEKTFLQFTVNGSLVGNENIVIGMFIASIILFTIGFIKSKYFKERVL